MLLYLYTFNERYMLKIISIEIYVEKKQCDFVFLFLYYYI